MKCKIRKTKEIVDVVGYSACTHTRFSATDYVCYINSKGEEIVGKGLNLIWDFEPINEESVNNFDWQSFRAEAAKDILSNALIPHALQQLDEVTVYDEDVVRIDDWIDKAVEWSDKLISKLKEMEVRNE